MTPRLYLLALFFVLLFFLGASVGSWLYVLAERLPKDENTIWKRSYCPSCLKTLPPRALIPLWSWLWQKRRCLFCQTPIPALYFIVELFTALGTLIICCWYGRGGWDLFPYSLDTLPRSRFWDLLLALWLFYSAIPLFFTDIRYYILPDVITIPGIFISVGLASCHPYIGWKSSLLGALVGGGLFGLTAFLYLRFRGEEGLGLGDVKYIMLLGGAVGLEHVFWIFLIACSIGSLFGLLKGLIQGSGIKTMIPFGPFLSIAGLLTHFLKDIL